MDGISRKLSILIQIVIVGWFLDVILVFLITKLIRKPEKCSILRSKSGVVLMFLESHSVGTQLQISHVTSVVETSPSPPGGSLKWWKDFCHVLSPSMLGPDSKGTPSQQGEQDQVEIRGGWSPQGWCWGSELGCWAHKHSASCKFFK